MNLADSQGYSVDEVLEEMSGIDGFTAVAGFLEDTEWGLETLLMRLQAGAPQDRVSRLGRLVTALARSP